ncbi:hypothetical protein AAZX31_03G218500 [Glycine max]
MQDASGARNRHKTSAHPSANSRRPRNYWGAGIVICSNIIICFRSPSTPHVLLCCVCLKKKTWKEIYKSTK